MEQRRSFGQYGRPAEVHSQQSSQEMDENVFHYQHPNEPMVHPHYRLPETQEIHSQAVYTQFYETNGASRSSHSSFYYDEVLSAENYDQNPHVNNHYQNDGEGHFGVLSHSHNQQQPQQNHHFDARQDRYAGSSEDQNFIEFTEGIESAPPNFSLKFGGQDYTNSHQLTGSFENGIFSSRYQRNNKRGGLKNLRCFPTCGFRHKERGFCGRSIEIELSHPPGLTTKGYFSWVEFVKKDDPPRFKLGGTYSIQKALALERSKDEPIKPLVRGERLDEKCTDTVSAFEFNKERRGWHYGWASNKHTCNAEHALQCYVLEPSATNPDEMCCRVIFQSPSFMLFCRRRRRFMLAPSAPTAVPIIRSKSSASLQEDLKQEAVKDEDEEDGDDDDEEDEACERANDGEGSRKKRITEKVALSSSSLLPVESSNSKIASQDKACTTTKTATYKPVGPSIQVARPPEKLLSSVSLGPAVVVSPARKRQLSQGGGESSRMEGVMRRLVVIMGRIQQQQERESAALKKRRKSLTADNISDTGSLGDLSIYHPNSVDNNDVDINALFQVFQENEEDSYEDWWQVSNSGGQSSVNNGFLLVPNALKGSSSESPFPAVPHEHVQVKLEPKDKVQTGEADDDSSGGGAPKELKRTTSDQMMEDVASYMRNEQAFSRAVEQLTKQSQNNTPNYQGFLRMVQDHLDSYRRSRNISRADFDRVFSKYTNKNAFLNIGGDFGKQSEANRIEEATSSSTISSGTKETEVSNTASNQQKGSKSLFSSAIGAFTSLVSSSANASGSSNKDGASSTTQPLYLEGPGFVRVPNIQGQWRQTEESEQAMQEMRNKMGTPWILSKMFEFMESRFEIEQHGFEMITRLNRKWISNTTMRFELDGELHYWGISLPGPFSQLSQGWTYRAWIEDNKIVLSHMIGDQRVTRINWVSRDRTILHSIVILELLDVNTGVYTEMGRVTQHAMRE